MIVQNVDITFNILWTIDFIDENKRTKIGMKNYRLLFTIYIFTFLFHLLSSNANLNYSQFNKSQSKFLYVSIFMFVLPSKYTNVYLFRRRIIPGSQQTIIFPAILFIRGFYERSHSCCQLCWLNKTRPCIRFLAAHFRHSFETEFFSK